MATAYIGMGANLGDRAETLCCATAMLEAHPDLRLLSASPVYETVPVGITDQPDFLNAVLQVETALSARALLDLLLEIERGFGRVRKQKWGARTLDLDLLLYGDAILREGGLQVPHPHMHERLFVLIPLCHLNSTGCHPVLEQTFDALVRLIGTGQGVRQVQGLSLLKDVRREKKDVRRER